MCFVPASCCFIAEPPPPSQLRPRWAPQAVLDRPFPSLDPAQCLPRPHRTLACDRRATRAARCLCPTRLYNAFRRLPHVRARPGCSRPMAGGTPGPWNGHGSLQRRASRIPDPDAEREKVSVRNHHREPAPGPIIGARMAPQLGSAQGRSWPGAAPCERATIPTCPGWRQAQEWSFSSLSTSLQSVHSHLASVPLGKRSRGRR